MTTGQAEEKPAEDEPRLYGLSFGWTVYQQISAIIGSFAFLAFLTNFFHQLRIPRKGDLFDTFFWIPFVVIAWPVSFSLFAFVVITLLAVEFHNREAWVPLLLTISPLLYAGVLLALKVWCFVERPAADVDRRLVPNSALRTRRPTEPPLAQSGDSRIEVPT